MNTSFSKFEISQEKLIGIPDDFFRHLLPVIDNLDLMKICLYIFWQTNTVGDYGLSFQKEDFLLDAILMEGFNLGEQDAGEFIDDLLVKACETKILIGTQINEGKIGKKYYINCEEGKKALVSKGDKHTANITLDIIQPNIFHLYEENIGPLTPIIAEALRDAEKRYPIQWMKEAIQIAVENNVRRWRYIESILERWQKEGRGGTDRKNDSPNYRRYIKG